VGEDKGYAKENTEMPGKTGVSGVNSLFLLIITDVSSFSVGLRNLFINNSVKCVLLKTAVVYKLSLARERLR